jgi:hypothetical protein
MPDHGTTERSRDRSVVTPRILAWADVRECPLSGKRRHWPKAAAKPRKIIRYG